ncbi:DUF874 domain-containing protein [Roseovarius sp. SYSU LYC5161]|uniref:DUF874 domain-containing protein n=1 Tax=Roseovarius halophilus (ex Wu et al. 2025) TaxID=3376060 RepID=UPI003999551E
METVYTLADFTDMVRRRFKLIAAVAIIGSAASVFLALGQQHMYQSAEVLQVAQPKVNDDLAPQTAGSGSARHLQLVQQKLMARDSVIEIADKYDLFKGRRPNERLVLMREAVNIDGIAAASDGAGDDGSVAVLTVSARMETPELARQVAHEFAQRTIDLSTRESITKARETLDFFVAEEQKLIDELETLEQERTAFRRENDLAISGSLEFRQTQYASISSALLEIEREMIALERELAGLDQGQRAATLEQQTRDIQAELASLEEQHVLLEERADALSSTIETTPRIERELAAFDRRVEKLQDQLDVVSDRRAQAEVAYKLEKGRQTARLTVIEPASLPDYPVTPSRKKAAALGGVMSVAAALILAFLLDLRHPVIRTSAQMKARLGFAPVVTIPVVDGKRKRRRGSTG